ncbi:MAG: NAD(+) diphosphatase [Microbacteriaceae bacterium]|nr:NAD(+) diphosphatase [Microbacteriaceae bacterium]
MSAAFSSRLALSRHEVDRDYLTRTQPQLFESLWENPATRVLLLWNGQALLSGDALDLRPVPSVPDVELLLYLGLDTRATPFIAAILSDDAAASLGADAVWGNLRTLGATLSDLETGLFTEALALANWHDAHRFSPRTGQPTVPALGGWVRRPETMTDATVKSHDLFPRTDAAIIVAVTDADDRILLGSNALWSTNRFSLLAGFVEPGESVESAVVREVFEESGVRVTNPEYLGSQPWPFPASLMLGFRATVDPDQVSVLTPDGDEILELRWFSRAELAASLDEIVLPGATSIARAILEEWFGGPISQDRQW